MSPLWNWETCLPVPANGAGGKRASVFGASWLKLQLATGPRVPESSGRSSTSHLPSSPQRLGNRVILPLRLGSIILKGLVFNALRLDWQVDIV